MFAVNLVHDDSVIQFKKYVYGIIVVARTNRAYSLIIIIFALLNMTFTLWNDVDLCLKKSFMVSYTRSYLLIFVSLREKKMKCGCGEKSDPFSTECDDLLKFVYADKKKATHFA